MEWLQGAGWQEAVLGLMALVLGGLVARGVLTKRIADIIRKLATEIAHTLTQPAIADTDPETAGFLAVRRTESVLGTTIPHKDLRAVQQATAEQAERL